MTDDLVSFTPKSVGAETGCGDTTINKGVRNERNTKGSLPIPSSHRHIKIRTPVSKFTATSYSTPQNTCGKVKKCLDQYLAMTEPTLRKHRTKSISMEDLTPSKRLKIETEKASKRDASCKKLLKYDKYDTNICRTKENAGKKILGGLMLYSWRRRREEVKCLRKTLFSQVANADKMKIQIYALKDIVDSDNDKVRKAISQIANMKELLSDIKQQKAVLEKEKKSLEEDVIMAEDKASGSQIEWQNCRNELQTLQAEVEVMEWQITRGKDKYQNLRDEKRNIYTKLCLTESVLKQQTLALDNAEDKANQLQKQLDIKDQILMQSEAALASETCKRESAENQCTELTAQLKTNALEMSCVKAKVAMLHCEVQKLSEDLQSTREQLDWWPKRIKRFVEFARLWLSKPSSASNALMWTLLPARRGC